MCFFRSVFLLVILALFQENAHACSFWRRLFKPKTKTVSNCSLPKKEHSGYIEENPDYIEDQDYIKEDLDYIEDLSYMRNECEIPPNDLENVEEVWNYNKLDNIDKVLSTEHDVRIQIEKQWNEIRANKFRVVHGYTVQLYAGNKREFAFELRQRVRNLCPDYTPQLHYESLNYLIWIGQFWDRIQALPTYLAICKVFPQIIIRQIDFVPFRESLDHNQKQDTHEVDLS